MKTYSDAIKNLLDSNVVLPPEIVGEVERFIKANAHLGYTSKEEFIQSGRI